MTEIIRCAWCGDDPLYVQYHDEEWGSPVHDDATLFEFLTLEGAQAGLSWITVLRKRENYRKHFHDWNIAKIAIMSDDELEKILLDPGVIRNRLKIYSVRKNAKVALEIQKEFGNLDGYFWNSQWFYPSYEKGRQGGVMSDDHSKPTLTLPYQGGDIPLSHSQRIAFPIINHLVSMKDFVAETEISKILSKDLKKRGMTFVGSTIMYAFMQAVGMVDDHIESCFRKEKS